MADDLLEHKEFTCPKCGSHEFGTATKGFTAGMTDEQWVAASTGMCHGYTGGPHPGTFKSCGFTWSRVDDDRYFKGTGRFYPRTATAKSP